MIAGRSSSSRRREVMYVRWLPLSMIALATVLELLDVGLNNFSLAVWSKIGVCAPAQNVLVVLSASVPEPDGISFEGSCVDPSEVGMPESGPT